VFSASLCAPIFAKPAPVAVVFSDSGRTFILAESRDLKSTLARDAAKKAVPGKKEGAVKKLLDSLGFFLCTYDTASKDTIRIDPAGRSRVDSIVINNAVFLTADSVTKLALPRSYDAGEIQSLAKKTIYVLGTKGYPFAALSIVIRPRQDSLALAAGQRRQALTIVFDVRENGRYAFAAPLITGAAKTDRRLLLHDVVFREGRPFDLRKVEESRERLLSRPYVTSADVSSPTVLLDAVLTPDTGAQAAAPPLDKVIVPISCADKNGFGFDGAVTFQAGGASAASRFYGVVNLFLLNLLRGGETGQLTYNGQQDLQRMELTVAKPYLLDFPVFASLNFGLEIKQDSYGYLHGGLEVLTELRAFWQLGLAVTGHEVQYPRDSSNASSQFGGVDVILNRQTNRYRAGEFARGFTLRTGSGLAKNNGRQFDRWHVDAAGNLHVPFTKRWAAAGRIEAKTIIARPEDSLRTAELYRTGGYNSLRGYADNEFQFKTVAFGQAECLFYFNPEGAIYIFADAGMGFGPLDQLTVPAATRLFGYGLGIRIPSRIGTAAIEWARNYSDTKSLGRIHVSVMNPISAAMGR
jgi:outer membrane protein assembly factor BamA